MQSGFLRSLQLQPCERRLDEGTRNQSCITSALPHSSLTPDLSAETCPPPTHTHTPTPPHHHHYPVCLLRFFFFQPAPTDLSFNNVVKPRNVLPAVFQPISMMRAGSCRNLPLSPPNPPPPTPEISLPRDGDSLGQSTCASLLIPLIHHRVSPRSSRISLSATAPPHFAPANNNKANARASVSGLEGEANG